MKLGKQISLGPATLFKIRTQLLAPKRGTAPPQFSANVRCDQTAGWIKMPLGTDVGLGPATFC